MYFEIINQCRKSLISVEALLDKAELYATVKNFEADLLMHTRLAPDMKPLSFQLQAACDYLKFAAAKLSGQSAPKHDDDETSFTEIRERIQKVVMFVDSVKQEEYEGAKDRKVAVSWAPGKVISGQNYLLQVVIPNFYFHIGMAYAILRSNGVDVGKMDFLGTVDLAMA